MTWFLFCEVDIRYQNLKVIANEIKYILIYRVQDNDVRIHLFMEKLYITPALVTIGFQIENLK